MMTSQVQQPRRGVVKQILSGDSVIIRSSIGAPPPEKQLSFSSVTAPKLARRAVGNAETKDEPYAWEAREFLRKKLIGEEVWFISDKPPNVNREYGTVYLGKDFNTAENITETLVSEGLVSVRRESNRNNAEVQHLMELEDAARSAGKGKWAGNPQDHVRDIKWSIDVPRNFVDKLKGKPVKAIIEHVRDGSTVRAFLLPDFYHITLMISGIRCPGFKLDNEGKPDLTAKVPFAEEARYFVEIRLLQRDVEIVLESVNNANFVGTILHPKGNIAEALLKEGFARCVDWSIAFMKSGAEKLRAAERQAKENRLRLWTDWQSTRPQISGKEKEFGGVVTEVVNGDVLFVKLNSGQVKKIFLASIRPPKEANRTPDEDGKPPARPKGFRPLYDIPWMFEAREFLRKKLIGKRVNVVVDYIQPAKDNYPEKICCTVTIGGVNVAEAMVSKGLATVIRYRQDDDQRSSHYDDLLAAETKASKSNRGVHSKDVPNHRVTDISGDSVKAKQFFPSFQRAQRIDALVEFVASGSRLRLFMPKDHCLCTFLLAGINCPRAARPVINGQPATEGEPFGDEALAYTKERCLQREVSVHVEAQDKAGNFIGWLWIDGANLSVNLVEAGLAAVHPNAERSEHHRALKAAEDAAKAKHIKRWANYVEEEKEEAQRIEEDKVVERKISYEEVLVTEITPELRFYAQVVEQGPKVEALNAKFRQEFQSNPPLPGSYTPKRGDICAAKFSCDGQWYRAKVEKVSGSNVNVFYIDYGNREIVNSTQCANLPSIYSSEKPYAQEYVLACTTLPKDQEYIDMAIKYLRDDTDGRTLHLNVEYRTQGSPPAATLTDPTTKEDLAKNLIAEGVLLVEKRREHRLQKLLNEYLKAQEDAKKSHRQIWQYGDITDDDAKEFGLGR